MLAGLTWRNNNMSNYEATRYDFSGANLTGIEGIPTATIVPWSSASVPSGFLECDGSAVSRSTYSALFAIVGTTYGAGDGASTFNLPDLQDNVAMGKSGTKALASTGGANTVSITATGNVGGSTANATISTSQLASHSHSVPTVSPTNPGSNIVANQSGNAGSKGTTNTGSGTGHSHNMSATFTGDAVTGSVIQPYLTLIYIIKT
jgi:microcystin-dependent protein